MGEAQYRTDIMMRMERERSVMEERLLRFQARVQYWLVEHSRRAWGEWEEQSTRERLAALFKEGCHRRQLTQQRTEFVCKESVGREQIEQEQLADASRIASEECHDSLITLHTNNKAPACRKLEPHDAATTLSSSDVDVYEWLVLAEFERRQQITDSHNAAIKLLRELWRAANAHYGDRRRRALAERETVARRVLEGEYYRMMLEACECLRILHMRELLHKSEPAERTCLVSAERHGWLIASAAEHRRKEAAEQKASEGDAQRVASELAFQQSLFDARHAILRFEFAGRCEVEREERVEFTSVSQDYAAPMDSLLTSQVLYEMDQLRKATTVQWTEESYLDVYWGEVKLTELTEREEEDARSALAASELKHYLYTRRAMLINMRAEESIRRKEESAAVTIAPQPPQGEPPAGNKRMRTVMLVSQ